MTRICSFPPLAKKDARVLILGSMPGVASLDAQQYYAHPRNLFWPIMGELVGAGPDLPYAERIRVLQAHRIAVWDVLQSCVREGSLDSAIAEEVPQDFRGFFKAHPDVEYVFFNGGKARQSFQRYVAKTLDNIEQLHFELLPSTSPAHAARSFAEKTQIWSRILIV